MKLIPTSITPTNVAVGAGVVILTPIVLPLVGSIAKPIFKAVIKGALVTYEGTRVAIAEAKESLEDITAEAKAEVAQSSDAGAEAKTEGAKA
ncbi:MAG: DUF5132 domain-containing protein [Desulfobacteraceae bacterium]